MHDRTVPLGAERRERGRGEEETMPDGFLSKTQAEVALDLVGRYLEFTSEEERARYRDADAYFGLYERAYKMILETAEKGEKTPTGFKT